ncbi:MAG: hypothetical protein ACXWQO_13020 [Bdellovibrionota bacterium]
MKLIAALFLLASSPALAAGCPNMVGNYKWVDALDDSAFIKIEIVQTGCTALNEIHDQGWGFKITHKHVIDGARRLVEDDGDFKAYETATMDEQGLHIREERYGVQGDKDNNQVVQIEITLPTAAELVIKRNFYRLEDMAPLADDKTVYKRQ